MIPSISSVASPEKDYDEFVSYFENRFPDTPFEDYKNGVYSIDKSAREQWEAMEEFPPYELNVDRGEELFNRPFKNGNTYYAEIYTIGIPRHPAQMYEALYCLLLFVSLLSLWYFKRESLKDGFIFSIFMIVLWSLRIIDELFKENQVDWEADIPLNMGQWLSIPMIILGIIIFIKTYPSKK